MTQYLLRRLDEPEGYVVVDLTSTPDVEAAITLAVNDLIAGAPGALDTLNELAAALGDDANFASTILNAIASEATLARNADNLSSGTVADARIASTIARDTEVTAAIIAALAASNVGRELGATERISQFTTTNVTYGNTSTTAPSGGKIPTFSVGPITGEGRAVDVWFYAPNVYHSVANNEVIAYLLINNAVTGGELGGVSSPATSINGRSLFVPRRVVLTNGVSYTFEVGIYGQSAGTCTLGSGSDIPITLQVTGR